VNPIINTNDSVKEISEVIDSKETTLTFHDTSEVPNTDSQLEVVYTAKFDCNLLPSESYLVLDLDASSSEGAITSITVKVNLLFNNLLIFNLILIDGLFIRLRLNRIILRWRVRN
jgi:hypothetical protein